MMWNRFLKPLLLLIGIGLTTVCIVQLLEFPFHKNFFQFKTLFLPLLLLTSAIYVFLGIPFLTLLFTFFKTVGVVIKFVGRHALLFSLLPFLFFFWFFQNWAIINAELTVGRTYFIIFPALLLAVFFLSFFKRVRPYLALLAPVLLILMAFGRALTFSTPTWNNKLAKTPEHPNVVLIVADTLRRDHTTIYGYERDTTPFLASLAQESVVFEDTLAPSAWTKPSMASLLTSRWLEQDPILIGPLPVAWKGMRLPEFFHRAGYQTALLTSNPNTGSYFEATRGNKWIIQATPPRHFALQTFVYPKLMHSYLRVKDWLKYRNTKLQLHQLYEHLGFKSSSELSNFKFGNLDSDRIPKEETEDYRSLAKGKMRNYSLANIRVRKAYPFWRRKFVIPLMDPIYRGILKFCYITLEGAKGRVENHWINDIELTNTFYEWYENEYDQERPFFVHMQYMGPHTPYQEQPPYFLPHFDKESGLDVENPPDQHTFPSQGTRELSAEKHHNLVANYNDSIRITDANIKMIVDYLKEKGEFDNTIFVFASDHGEAFYEHDIYGHMYSLHAEMVNVPLFFYYPAKLKPERNKLPASLVDIYPSLIHLAGLDKYRGKAGELEGMTLFQSDGTLASAAHFNDRVRYGITRTSYNARKGKNKKAQNEPRPFGPPRPRHLRKKQQVKAEGIHRMVVKNGQKLVEEREGKNKRVFLYSLDDPREERIERDYNDPIIKSLFSYFRPLPQEYLDANEPVIQNQPGEPEPEKEEILEEEPKIPQKPVALGK